MKISEVAALAGVHHGTVRKHIATGRLTATLVRGRPSAWIIDEDEAHRYAKAARDLLEKSGEKLSADLAASSFVSARQLQAMAGISRPTLIKHINAGLVKGERRRFGGRKILAFEKKEADRYAKVAREIVTERTHDNLTRGPRRAPAGYWRLDELARKSHVNIFTLYRFIQEEKLAAVKDGQLLLVREKEARRFFEKQGRRPAPRGLISIPDAAERFGIDRRTVDYAVAQGYIAAVPAGKTASSRTQRISTPQTLISEEDANRYFGTDKVERRRERELRKALAVAGQLQDMISHEQ